MTRLEAIQNCLDKWKRNLGLVCTGRLGGLQLGAPSCDLCTLYLGEECKRCPIKELDFRGCRSSYNIVRPSVYFDFVRNITPGNAQAMIDLLTKCEEIELKRLEDEKMKDIPPKYRALRDGTGYQEGGIFTKLDCAITEDGEAFQLEPYGIDGLRVPLFSEMILKDSPDFEEVEELWEPKEGESFDTIISNTLDDTEDGLDLRVERVRRIPPDKYYENHLAKGLVFRPDGWNQSTNAQSCLGEVTELIKKRSKESRKL